MGIENIRLEPILYQGDQENRKKNTPMWSNLKALLEKNVIKNPKYLTAGEKRNVYRRQGRSRMMISKDI